MTPSEVNRNGKQRDTVLTLAKSASENLGGNDSSSDISSSNVIKNDREEDDEQDDSKKFLDEAAVKLEGRLIEKEFYKHYSSGVIQLVFVIIFLSNVFINVDHGSLPGCSGEIKKDLSMNNFEFGLLGSVVYGGLTVGAGVATGIYAKSSWIKPTLICSLLLNSLSIWLFTVSNSFYFNMFLRFWIGFFQVFLVIFMPVWGDAFSSEKQKSAWLTFLLLASPLGVVGGFTLTSFMVGYANWRWSFYIQAACIVPCAIFLILTPAKYLDVEETVRVRKQCAQAVQQKLYKSLNTQSIRRESVKDEVTNVETEA